MKQQKHPLIQQFKSDDVRRPKIKGKPNTYQQQLNQCHFISLPPLALTVHNVVVQLNYEAENGAIYLLSDMFHVSFNRPSAAIGHFRRPLPV